MGGWQGELQSLRRQASESQTGLCRRTWGSAPAQVLKQHVSFRGELLVVSAFHSPHLQLKDKVAVLPTR